MLRRRRALSAMEEYIARASTRIDDPNFHEIRDGVEALRELATAQGISLALRGAKHPQTLTLAAQVDALADALIYSFERLRTTSTTLATQSAPEIPKLTPEEQRVLRELAKYTKYRQPVKILAEKVRLSIYHTRRVLRSLEALGLIEKERQGRGQPNLYALTKLGERTAITLR